MKSPIAIAALLLAGCASGPIIDPKSSKTPENFYLDQMECERISENVSYSNEMLKGAVLQGILSGIVGAAIGSSGSGAGVGAALVSFANCEAKFAKSVCICSMKLCCWAATFSCCCAVCLPLHSGCCC